MCFYGARDVRSIMLIRIHTETEGDFEAGKRSEAILGNEPAQWRPTLLPAGCIVRGVDLEKMVEWSCAIRNGK